MDPGAKQNTGIMNNLLNELIRKEFLTTKLIKLKEPWVSFISEDYKFKNNSVNELEIVFKDIII